MINKKIIAFVVLILSGPLVFGQQFSNDALRENMRNWQLTGNYRAGYSYCVNPNTISLKDFDSVLHIQPNDNLQFFSSGHGMHTGFLPFSYSLLNNSTLPSDWNLGAMIPARGYQHLISAGAFINIGKHITLQAMPEWVYAANKPFEGFSQQLGDEVWARYYRVLNSIDMPTQFGTNRYNKLFPGQSSIRYNTKHMSFGISTESLWWGPGWRNALVMSTNASGFIHFTADIIKPIRTPVGDFEGQVIAGKLDESNIDPPRMYSVYNSSFVYTPKRKDWRYITGMVVAWKPKWTPGLSLGIAKASYLYHDDITNPLDALPLQGFFGQARTASERNGKKSSFGSLFARYVMPKEQAEVYIEYGRKDISMMPWKLFTSTPYRRAYVAGLRKLFSTRRPDTYIQWNFELTELSAPSFEQLSDPDSWYTSTSVTQGYTQLGKVMGAGIGPGGSSQTMEISWVRGLKRIGLEFERLKHNNDFYMYTFATIPDFRRYWVDLSTSLKGEWNYKRWMISSKFSLVRSYNYQWLIISVDPTQLWAPSNEFLNFSGRVQLTYRL